MALLSGFAGVYTEVCVLCILIPIFCWIQNLKLFNPQAIMKKRPSRNVNVQNFWLYVFGMVFNAMAILVQDFDAVMNK